MSETQAGMQAIVLGRGIEMQDGKAVLGLGSVQRAERAVEHYFENRRAYDDNGLIVCSGGRPRLAEDRFTNSEAGMMADIMVRAGVPHGVIETEKHSTDTLSNFLYSAPFFAQHRITSDTPLNVVSHRSHWRRARLFGSKVLGVPMRLVEVPGEEDTRRWLQEDAMYLTWAVLLFNVADGDTLASAASKNWIDAHVSGTLSRQILRKLIK